MCLIQWRRMLKIDAMRWLSLIEVFPKFFSKIFIHNFCWSMRKTQISFTAFIVHFLSTYMKHLYTVGILYFNFILHFILLLLYYIHIKYRSRLWTWGLRNNNMKESTTTTTTFYLLWHFVYNKFTCRSTYSCVFNIIYICVFV